LEINAKWHEMIKGWRELMLLEFGFRLNYNAMLAN
jgi:hypothetical protein